MLDGTPPKPHRGQLLHFYSRHYYAERVRPLYEVRMTGLKNRAKFSNEPVPEPLPLQNAVTLEVWEKETPAFQKEVELAWEREYQAKLRGWEASLSSAPARTAEELAS